MSLSRGDRFVKFSQRAGRIVVIGIAGLTLESGGHSVFQLGDSFEKVLSQAGHWGRIHETQSSDYTGEFVWYVIEGNPQGKLLLIFRNLKLHNVLLYEPQ